MTDNVVDFNPRPTIRILPAIDNVQGEVIKALPLLEASIRRDERNVSMEDVVEDLLEGRSLLWTVHLKDTLIAALTTCVMKHPQRHTLFIEHMGGAEMKIWMNAALSMLKEVAAKGELSGIEAHGRIGFAKFAQEHGFVEKYRHFEMEL